MKYFLIICLFFKIVFVAKTQEFAVIGDYGYEGNYAKAVSEMVKLWNPSFIISVGDDNYQGLNGKSIDTNCGQYYHQYIGNYQGDYGEGSSVNNFYTVLGNADYKKYEGHPRDYLLDEWFNFFTLPNNEQYYDFVRGDIHFFAINSNSQALDGILAESVQGQWIKNKLANSISNFNIVFMHQTPYSSAKLVYKNGEIKHGSNSKLQWSFQEWGADIVFSGDDHFY